MYCARCQLVIAPGTEHCTRCGDRAGVSCPRCSQVNLPGSSYCGRCASSLHTLKPGPEPQQGERRQLTVLFCDVVGMTELSARLDPEDLRELLRDYYVRCGDAVRRFDGYVAQYLGDGLLVYFGYPHAREDAARRAVLAGLSMIASIGEMDAQRHGGVRLSVRVGIHTGTTIVGELGDSVRREWLAIGETPNLAARVQGAAEPGTVVITAQTKLLVQKHFRFEALGAHTLKGVAQPVVLHRVLDGASSDAQAKLSTLVGRARELDVLTDAWLACRDGGSPAIALVGEPGIGKSRLVQALMSRVGTEAEQKLAQCSGLFTSTALWPILRLLENELGFGEISAHADKLARLQQQLSTLQLDHGEALALLAPLLSIPYTPDTPRQASPQADRAASFEVLLQWLVQTAHPRVLTIEDLHWADPSTLEFLSMLIERAHPGLLLVLTHRPEFTPTWNHERVNSMALERLASSDAEAIVRDVFGAVELEPRLLGELLARGDGVPLFLEEITKATLERGSDAESATPIPMSLQDSLAARLDRLGEGKSIVQLAAVVGRSFSLELLSAVSSDDRTLLLRWLERLVEADLLQRQDDQFVFKHALIQDAAYASMLRSTRQHHHREFAAALVARWPELADKQPEWLAQHYADGAVPERASHYFAMSGAQALARSAYLEGLRASQRALEQLALTPHTAERDRHEVEVRTTLGLCLIITRGYSSQEVADNFQRAAVLCSQNDDVPMGVLYGTWAVQIVRANVDMTQTLACKLLEYAESERPRVVRRLAFAALATRAFWAGELDASVAYADRAIALYQAYDEPGERDFGYEGYFYPYLYKCRALHTQGRPRAAWTTWHEALVAAQALKTPNALAMVGSFGAYIAHDCVDDLAVAVALADEQLVFAREHGLHFWVALALVNRGFLRLQEGAHDTAIDELKQGLELLQMIGADVVVAYANLGLTEAYLQSGRLLEAEQQLERAFAFNADKLAHQSLPALQHQRGELLRLRADLGAEAAYREAIATARRQHAQLLELRSAVALAQWLVGQGRRDEARALLRECLASFDGERVLREYQRARAYLSDLEPPSGAVLAL